ncbi:MULTISPECIES: alpha/beta fold hydrolase [unclassified Nonomuraea]
MGFAAVAGVRLFYTDDGSGDTTLLLVHGWGADSHQWARHIPTLAGRHRVIAVDLRGHGYSSAEDKGNNPVRMSEDLVDLLDLLDVERCVIVGHSMGAVIASRLAVEHPARVTAVIGVDPGYGRPDEVVAMAVAMREAPAVQIDQWCYTPASPGWLREWHRRRLLATPPHVLAEAYDGLWSGEEAIGSRGAAEPYLSRRTCPVLTFWTDPAQAAWETGLFTHPASRTVCWQGSGHRLHEERPAEFLLVVNQWLKEISR